MKKIIIFITLIFIGFSGVAQQTDSKKFEIAASYAVVKANDHSVFRNPISLSASYTLKNWGNLSVQAGVQSFYFSSKKQDNYTNKWAFNPNIKAAYVIENTPLKPYFGIGYYFDSYTFKLDNLSNIDPFDPLIIPVRSQKIKTQSLSVTPGIKCFLGNTFFVDAHLMLMFKKDEISNENYSQKLLNLGVGVAF